MGKWAQGKGTAGEGDSYAGVRVAMQSGLGRGTRPRYRRNAVTARFGASEGGKSEAARSCSRAYAFCLRVWVCHGARLATS